MSDRPSQRPAFCPFIYRDRDNLYLEFANHVERFAFTDGGLNRALRHIPDVSKRSDFVGRNASINRVLPKIAKTTARKREILSIDKAITDAAAEIVRKMGIGE